MVCPLARCRGSSFTRPYADSTIHISTPSDVHHKEQSVDMLKRCNYCGGCMLIWVCSIIMFWKFDLNTTSHVDKLLDKEDVTLHELMDEDDILQECKAQNRKLLDFICQQHCMEELVSLITHEPPVDMDEKVRFKYPNTACELLTSDVPQINDKLGGDETLLNILYDFLDHEPPLNPLLASFFSKTIGNLIARKTEQVVAFLRRKDQFISLVLKHIDTSAMMDLLLRLISCVEPAPLRQEVLNWLNEAKVIQRLVALIHSSQDEDKTSILTTIGVLEEPLGNARLHGARLIAALLHTNTPSINYELCRLNTMDLLLDLFFKYTWNNFLHFQVELCIAAILSHSVHEGKSATNDLDNKEEVLNGNVTTDNLKTSDHSPENIMVTHLFQGCCLLQRILDAWEVNDKIQAEGGMRRGNMGHLTRIANAVVQNMEKGPMQTQTSEFIKELPEDCRGRWESFVEETLRETNRKNTVDLVSTHHLHSSSEDEDIESAFPNELSLQQAFSEYQIQQMTANFVDQFGFNDEEFADQDDNINAPFDRIAEINFNIDADDDSPNASLFEACCNERIQQFDDKEEEEDIWEEKEITYATQVKSRTRFGVSQTSESSSKSDLENGDHDGSVDSEEEEEPEEQTPLTENTNKNNPSEQKDSDSTEEKRDQKVLNTFMPAQTQGSWSSLQLKRNPQSMKGPSKDYKKLDLLGQSDADCLVIDKLTITDMGTTKVSKPLRSMPQRSEELQTAAAVGMAIGRRVCHRKHNKRQMSPPPVQCTLCCLFLHISPVTAQESPIIVLKALTGKKTKMALTVSCHSISSEASFIICATSTQIRINNSIEIALEMHRSV
ncbi:Serine/threonine-protein phosphatase 6 regulatory subunit 2 [Chelonia mydas]|uniref:Serine/threonine-protein phosphatase 6 regulatory subunit 2 n=1 Tax=Chelonia mydas TaxID=8469 RepID=M7AWS5_CHEMY|nr:Serine/threonine-protein phosphatase 6 regulatory subunit 2 [Chelonia mydas]